MASGCSVFRLEDLLTGLLVIIPWEDTTDFSKHTVYYIFNIFN